MRQSKSPSRNDGNCDGEETIIAGASVGESYGVVNDGGEVGVGDGIFDFLDPTTEGRGRVEPLGGESGLPMRR
jgi:hypothetical protein